MSRIDESKVEEIVAKVVERLAPQLGGSARTAVTPSPGGGCGPTPPYARTTTGAVSGGRKLGVYDDLDSAVGAARIAHEQLVDNVSLEARDNIIEALRQCGRDEAENVARMAVEETGLGRVEDKIFKNLLVANKTPGTEILRPTAITGDHGFSLIERAPFGVIGSITPTTNPTETIICNAIGMIAGGNAVVFNVHPGAKNTCRYFVRKANEYMQAAGAPEGILSMIGEPTIETANGLMKHPGVRLVVVTGGPGVVKAAMNSGKRAICGGPGNPPVLVDETADIRKAGKGIVAGGSFDNNVICTDEKEVFVVSDVADLLKKEMCSNGAVEMSKADIAKLEKLVTDGKYPTKEWVGQDAAKIADAIGKKVPSDTRMLLCEVDSEDHPFIQVELLMPVMGLMRVRDWESGMQASIRAEHGFGHTASMYSQNVDRLHAFARASNVSIFVKNASNFAGLGHGGEGYTSFTIASPTGEGLTTAVSFTRERRCTLKDNFRIV
jgi:acyl-CoA reductase-like NAD-dependent aldehyde dehydrogenase